MERVRLFLRLRDKLKGKRKPGEVVTPVSPTQPKCAIPESVKLDEKEKGCYWLIINKMAVFRNSLKSTSTNKAKDSNEQGGPDGRREAGRR